MKLINNAHENYFIFTLFIVQKLSPKIFNNKLFQTAKKERERKCHTKAVIFRNIIPRHPFYSYKIHQLLRKEVSQPRSKELNRRDQQQPRDAKILLFTRLSGLSNRVPRFAYAAPAR